MHPEIARNQAKLDHLFRQTRLLQDSDDVDDELKAQFVWYLCVRTSGFLESSIKLILLDYVESNTNSRRVVDFANERLQYSRGLKRGEILGLVKQFSQEWRTNLGTAITNDHGRSLKDLVKNRNDIAHGKDVYNLSLKDVEQYFADASNVVRLVYEECHPLSTTLT